MAVDVPHERTDTMTPETQVPDDFVTYDELRGPDLDVARWTPARLPLPTGDVHIPLDPDAELTVGEGEVRVAIPRFSLSHDKFQAVDSAKYLTFATREFELPPDRPATFAVDLAVENIGGDPADYRRGMAAFHVFDMNLSQRVFAVVGTSTRVFAMHEQLGLGGGGAGEPFYYVIESPYEEFDDDITRLRTCEITLDRGSSTAAWRVDGRTIYEAHGTLIPEHVRIGLGIWTMLPIRDGRSRSLDGQGIDARWRGFRVRVGVIRAVVGGWQRMTRFGLALCIAALTMAVAAPARAQANPCPGVPSYDWQGRSVARQVTVQVGDGPAYAGTVLRPRRPVRKLGRMPGVVLMHGAGGSQCGLWWAARHLAGHGYVTLVITHDGNLAGHEQAVRAGVRWLRSRSNPFRDLTLRNRIGLAGHSQGSNASLLAQDEPGVRALVALDSLKRFARGDRAAALGCTRPRNRVTPLVPALGFAMDGPCANRPALIVPDLKKTGHALWKSAGRPTMTLVMRGFEHSSFTSRGTEEQLRNVGHFLLAWFDRYLQRDRSATKRILARRVARTTDAAALEHDVPLGGLPAREDRLRGLRRPRRVRWASAGFPTRS